MAVQLDYLAPKGWSPPNPDRDYVVTLVKIELAEGISENKFSDAAASFAAESSTGTWTKVEDRADSGIGNAKTYKAVAYDLDPTNHMFKVAYPVNLFEHDNMSGLLAGVTGNIAGMKMIKGERIYDIRFPEALVKAFPGPRFGIEGARKLLEIPERPIMGTVPKPKVGRTAEEQAALARRLWTAGDGTFEFIKDDENLTSLPFNTFDERCKLVHQAQKEIEKKLGRKKLYLCNITHSDIAVMKRRADMIKEYGGYCMMMDVVTTGFAAAHTMRMQNPGLMIHAHRAMHGFMTRESGQGIQGQGELKGFSVAMIVLAKIFRLLGVDSLHTGSPKSKMEDYNEAEIIAEALRTDETPAHHMPPTLGQKWFGMKKVWATASGGLHPGVLDVVIKKMTNDIYIQMGGGVLGHPGGAGRGVEAALEARKAIMARKTIREFVKENPSSALAEAAKYWGFEPKIVY